ncbi:MAG TPA: ImmA/IrrE family metallo-endopeptidase [Bacteroidales bacterium]|nr:ImmA/IrrE family metallo-endopeptidase [Bacteroidales bacterium]
MADNSYFKKNTERQRLAKALLRECKIEGPPTNRDLILDYFGLQVFKLSKIIDQPMQQISTDIRAILDRKPKRIYLHDSVLYSETMVNFSIFHEIGHFVLPNHESILRERSIKECEWKDLNPFSEEYLELEANAFAADCIFQINRFTEDALRYPLSLKAPFKLSQVYNVSFEASFRRYVEMNPFPCALVVYKPETFDDASDALVVNYTITSSTFREFKYIKPHQKVGATEDVARLFYDYGGSGKDFQEIELNLRNPMTGETASYKTECFTNRYKVFQLVRPEWKNP